MLWFAVGFTVIVMAQVAIGAAYDWGRGHRRRRRSTGSRIVRVAEEPFDFWIIIGIDCLVLTWLWGMLWWDALQ